MASTSTNSHSLSIRRLASAGEAHLCARLMSSSEPWLTLGRDYEESLALVQAPDREAYIAYIEGRFTGFLILTMQGAFVGYIQTICVAPEARGSGVGTELVHFAERRIFAEVPNVFLCVSSFNPRARTLYERLGYEMVGELTNYLVAGHSEYLLRKTIAPIRGFRHAQNRRQA